MSADLILNSKWRKDFPTLQQKIKGKSLVYLDSGATSLKPLSVIERIQKFNMYEISNVHRGAHFLSDQATGYYEGARAKVANFIGAQMPEEIVFVRGTTEAINLVANTLCQKFEKGDEILISEMEHHANIVPWQIVADQRGLTIKVIPILEDGELDFNAYQSLLNSKTKVLAITACSNHIGNRIDLKPYIDLAAKNGTFTVVDGAQIVGKFPVNVKELNCDFFCFSGHKMFAPFGIGIMYGKKQILDSLAPYQGGGSMISKVSFSGTTFNDVPTRFEAGTPNVEGAIGLAAAIDYISQFSWDEIIAYEDALAEYTFEKLNSIDGIKFVGHRNNRIPLFSFNINGIHSSDLGQVLDNEGVAVRCGHHCTQPLIQKLKINGSCRVSLSLYNDKNDIDSLYGALIKAKELLT